MAAGGLLLTGCSGPVAVPDPTPTGSAAAVCAGLLAALPAVNLEQDRREVDPGAFSAAWGDPAIVLRCGVTKPPRLTAASPCYEVNGVGWFAEEAETGVLFTTIGREVFVEVGVPKAYAPEANALVDLAAAITDTVPQDRPCA